MDELTKDLLQSRHRLQATEEEMRGKEEETAMVRFIIRLTAERLAVQTTVHVFDLTVKHVW